MASASVDPAEIVRYIADTFDGVNVAEANGDTFFVYDPDRQLPPERQMPFATLVSSDAYDQVSNLNRPGVYRLNIGVSRETYRSLFGPPPPNPGAAGIVDTGHDFSTLDQVMPHPVYAMMSWVCVLNPTRETFQAVQGYLAEAHAQAARHYARIRPAADS
jgi:hypothetical protein